MKQLIALAMLLPMSLFADERKSDNPGVVKEVSHTVLLASLSGQITTLRNDVTTIATTLGRVETKLARLAPQIAIVMTVPYDCRRGRGRIECMENYYLLGSTISGFPRDTVDAETLAFKDATLPEGKYLVEVHQPYSSNLLCQSNTSGSGNVALGSGVRVVRECPQLVVGAHKLRLDFGSRVYNVGSAGMSLNPHHRFPGTWVFTEREPAKSYIASIKITKL